MRHFNGFGGLCVLTLVFVTACTSSPGSGARPAGTGGAASGGEAGRRATAAGTGGATSGGEAGKRTDATGTGGTGNTVGTGGTTGDRGGSAGETVDAAVPAGMTGGSRGSGGGAAGDIADAATRMDADVAETGTDGGAGDFGVSGPSRCATAGVLLCESFENGLDTATWKSQTGTDEMIGVDNLRAFRGSKSLHVKVSNTATKASISETKTFPMASKVLYARMFLWFDTLTTRVHFTIAEAPGSTYARFGGISGRYGVGTDHGASGDWTDTDTGPVPTKRWTCVEFAFRGDTNEFQVWLDDVDRPALHVGSAKHPGFTLPAFSSLWFGWQTYSNQSPGELWIDEIAIDSKPIGCAK